MMNCFTNSMPIVRYNLTIGMLFFILTYSYLNYINLSLSLNYSCKISKLLNFLETGVYDICFFASTTLPSSSPFGFGLSFSGQTPSRNFSTNVISSAVSFSTIITLTAGTANTISIPNTGETTAILSVFRTY